MQSLKTWEAKIYCGLRAGYTNKLYHISKLMGVCQDYCNDIGWCVTVTPTVFIYKNGYEEGAIVGIINYPRFPLDEEVIGYRCMELASKLLEELGQLRVSVVFPNDTVVIESEELQDLQIIEPSKQKPSEYTIFTDEEEDKNG